MGMEEGVVWNIPLTIIPLTSPRPFPGAKAQARRRHEFPFAHRCSWRGEQTRFEEPKNMTIPRTDAFTIKSPSSSTMHESPATVLLSARKSIPTTSFEDDVA